MYQRFNLADIGFRHLQDVQAEEILDLQGRDHDGDTTGKAQSHWGGDVLDKAAEPRHPHGQQEKTGEQGRH